MMNSNFTTGSSLYRIMAVEPTLTVVLAISILSILAVVISPNAYATSNNSDNSVKMTKQGSFINSDGNLNIVGAIDNNGMCQLKLQ